MTLFAPDAGHIDGPRVQVAFTVAYRGTDFRGFAAQPGIRTIGGVLTAALERTLRHTVELTCSGRTDAGVHAWGQVVTFSTREGVDVAGLARSVNKAVGPAIVVRSACLVPEAFDARRSATGRRYRYTVLNRGVPDPFLAETTWHVAPPLDVRAMRLACDPLYGEHDFASFCRRIEGSTLVRRVREADWTEAGEDLLQFDIEASSFCQQMVRSVVGTMIEIGLGKRAAGDMAGVLRARNRQMAGEVAPPHGLCLWEVTFEGPGGVDPG